MTQKYIMALDQGTTSSRAIIFNHAGEVIAVSSQEFKQIYPKPGFVEHDPMEILDSQINVAKRVLELAGISPENISAIGITNQRETSVIWDKNTGKPVYNAIVWQCRRSSGICEELKASGLSEEIKKRTGLVIDAYFSGTKIKWLFDNNEHLKSKINDLSFGTIDTWLLYNLTGAKVHCTDYSNASRTMLFNIHTLEWDDTILKTLGIPAGILPKVCPSSEIYGYTDEKIFGVKIPIASIAGDQQAALFGQGCFKEGNAKNTYGTGCFLLLNTGNKPVISSKGLITSIGWKINDEIIYVLEGSVFIAGAVIQWLRDELKIISSASQSEEIATSVKDTGGVYFVPAFVGLGAPYWDSKVRGAILGLTRGSCQPHIVRAALESIAYQTKDVIKCMQEDTNMELNVLRVDGGAAQNNFLMQFQSDILNIPVERPKVLETTALGVAYLAGLAVGYWQNKEEIGSNWQCDKTFYPAQNKEKMQNLYVNWINAVKQVRI